MLTIALVAGTAAIQARTLSFSDNRHDYVVGNTPSAAAVGDFNLDGKKDLAVANVFSNNISILLGDGAGGYLPAYTVNGGTGPQAIATSDFNGDGITDLVVTNPSFFGVSVMLGRGDGNFGPPLSTRGVAQFPNFLAVNDFNKDRKSDLLVIGGSGPAAIAILLGNGDGTLQAPLYSATGVSPVNAAVADFNGDGKPDVAVSIYQSNLISILLGNRNGRFAAPVKINAGVPVSSNAAELGSLYQGVGDILGATDRFSLNCPREAEPYHRKALRVAEYLAAADRNDVWR